MLRFTQSTLHACKAGMFAFSTSNRSKVSQLTGDSSILLSKLVKISSERKEFLFGSADKELQGESLFDTVNKMYAGAMRSAQKTEIGLFIGKQREHYIHRLDEEVTEFLNEKSEGLKEFERHELDHFQNELLNDTKEFSDQRQKECQLRLEEDVRKYQFSVIPLSSDDNGCDTSGESQSLISSYIDRRHNFYEHLLNREIVEYMHKRKIFYEELLRTRLARKAECVRDSIEKFQAKRETHYKEKLERDADWMSNSFQGHYEKCFLQCFARYAWLFYRQQAMKTSDIATTPEIVRGIPLKNILDEYERETMADVGRDVFLKAARSLGVES